MTCVRRSIKALTSSADPFRTLMATCTISASLARTNSHYYYCSRIAIVSIFQLTYRCYVCHRRHRDAVHFTGHAAHPVFLYRTVDILVTPMSGEATCTLLERWEIKGIFPRMSADELASVPLTLQTFEQSVILLRLVHASLRVLPLWTLYALASLASSCDAAHIHCLYRISFYALRGVLDLSSQLLV